MAAVGLTTRFAVFRQVGLTLALSAHVGVNLRPG